MQYNLEDLINKIITSSYFLRLKNVIENNDYHDHESVYDHLLKTKDRAQKEIQAAFITDAEAKKLFFQFVDEDLDGMKRKDIMVLIALVHDIGKILTYEEDGKKESINMMLLDGKTRCFGHEYYGSIIVSTILKDLLQEKTVAGIAQVVKLHDTFNADYFQQRTQWNDTLLMRDIKASAEERYIECLFNIYCDCHDAPIFKEAKERIVRVFNNTELYIPRKYYIPE